MFFVVQATNTSKCRMLLEANPEGYLKRIVISGSDITPANRSFVTTVYLVMLDAMGLSGDEIDYLIENTKHFNSNQYKIFKESSVWFNNIFTTIVATTILDNNGKFTILINDSKFYGE